ncbi:sugar phosphate isomerase/epimerase [Streptomyces tubbatahanensis]|uniref:Sugar phosphate isomerase/epimerase n=1 Tax=Streptomyces tubbatahanensis TaxID=2923272 RepID=A0ABY3XZX6_9ACTN|nr:sugar phosphate isomerase/epimerase family protein [Streptomyces tubbatahanensis]UNS99838.1 sugar phosphate isomerase/epimerase [Streptomyces tubbatahanensis]
MPAERDHPQGPFADRCAGIGDEAAPDLAGQIEAVRALGWRRVELRTVGRTALADLAPEAVRDLAHRLRDADLGAVCLASRIGNWARPVTTPFETDLAELETLLDQCAVLECRFVRVMSYPNDGLQPREWAREAIDRLGRLARRAQAVGVTLLHENCAGWAGESATRMLRLLRETDSPALRLLFDTGNGVPHGYDAAALLRQILPYVEHVHIKDARRTAQGATEYVLPGDGEAQVADCLRTLLESGYRGAFSLEPHLSAQPHAGVDAGTGAARPFVAAGRRLERLLAPHHGTAARAAGTP